MDQLQVMFPKGEWRDYKVLSQVQFVPQTTIPPWIITPWQPEPAITPYPLGPWKPDVWYGTCSAE